VYTRAWQGLCKHTLGLESNAFWHNRNITTPAIMQTLRARMGQLWNKKLALRYKMPYLQGNAVAIDDLCPLCHEPDSAGHILGGCKHADMTKLYISRHNAAARLILKEAQQGAQGNFITIADIGRNEVLRDLHVDGQRIPEWLISDSMLEATGMDPSFRYKLRHDIHDLGSHQG
jgi:hypothetical protein